MRIIELDLSCVKDKSGFHEYVSKIMNFPEYYGKNLDALNDLLSEISEPTLVHLKGVDKMQIGEYGNSIIETFVDQAESNRFFHVLMRSMP